MAWLVEDEKTFLKTQLEGVAGSVSRLCGCRRRERRRRETERADFVRSSFSRFARSDLYCNRWIQLRWLDFRVRLL